MPAYIVSEILELRPEPMREYLARARPAVAKYGGRYLASTAALEALEGDTTPARLVVIEFESAARAREWYRSPEYSEALKVRDAALTRRLFLVEGKVD